MQLTNMGLTSQPTSGKYNVWFPQQNLGQIGLGTVGGFGNGGFLPFDTAADAQAHVQARGLDVILDTQGGFDAVQPWGSASAYALQISNLKLEKARTDGLYSVRFPQQILANIGMGDAGQYPRGAFLSFNTLQEAQNHAKLRAVGVVLDAQGKYDPAAQVWSGASAYAPPVWPPPPAVNDQAPIGTADIIGMYGQATPTGAQIVIRTHNQLLNETLAYELYVVIGGSEMKVKDLGAKSMTTPGSYVLDAPFDIDYSELTNLVSVAVPGAVVGSGTQLSVKVKWPSGHDQGAAGAGGRGAHRMLAP